MRSTLKTLFLLAGGLLLVTVPAHSTVLSDAVVINQQPFNENALWDYALDGDGRIWFAYYGDNNKLYLRRPDGSQIELGAHDRRHFQSGLAMDADKNGVALMWRDKLPEKTLYYITETPGAENVAEPTVLADAQTEPLPRLLLAKQDEATYFLWYGEKSDPENKKTYHLYFRYADGEGDHLSEIDRVLPGIYPAWIVDGGETIPVFSWAFIDGRQVMAMRAFDRKAKSFGPVKAIADSPATISPYFHAFESSGRWFLTWLGHYGDENSELLIEGIYSDDQGQNWKRFAFESLRGFDPSRVEFVPDEKGHIMVALSGRWRQRDPSAKDDVYLIRSTDNGSTWSEPQRMRTNAVRYATARYPSVVFGAEEGSVMILWEDWRDIRPNVYVNYSSDYGRTWWEDPVSLTTPGSHNITLDYEVTDALRTRNGRYYLAAQRYLDDTLKNPDLVLFEFGLQELQQLRQAAEGPNSENATQSRLRERVEAYWEAMKNENYETTYAMHDPFFRAKVNWIGYRVQMGKIKYHSYEIGEIALQGKLAEISLKVEASVPGFKVRDQVFSRPKKKYPVVEKWIFVDGDWYREYYSEATDLRYTQY